MQHIEAKVIDPLGLHMRPAGILVNEAQKYESEVKIIEGSRSIVADSVVDMISFGIKQGAEIIIQTSGEDEVQALAGVVNVLKAEKVIKYNK